MPTTEAPERLFVAEFDPHRPLGKLYKGHLIAAEKVNDSDIEYIRAPVPLAEDEVDKEREAIIDWLAHRCDYGPPCGRCTYCRVARYIQTRGGK